LKALDIPLKIKIKLRFTAFENLLRFLNLYTITLLYLFLLLEFYFLPPLKKTTFVSQNI
jgi:hypothetical protein